MSLPTDGSVMATPTCNPHPAAAAGPSRILLIDPDGLNQWPLVQALTTAGCVVYIVGRGSDAWDLIPHWQPHLILLEATLTDQSGFALCEQIKQALPMRRIPVMFFGSGQPPSDRLRAFEVGGVDFIAKPYWLPEVMARVRSQLAPLLPALRSHPGQRSAPQLYSPLLANLQKTLHRQAMKLQEQNVQLQQEIHERQQVEQALRQEQQKSEQLLLNILPEAIVTQLKQFQGSLAERFEEATVLFADIVNFTPLASQCLPLELVNLLNQIFSAFDRLADKYQLEKIKTIGDAYMAVGGVPVPLSHHAAAVADMALEMQTVIQQFQRPGEHPLQLRIGINTGSVVAGVIGIKKFSYDLWGDTVNVASRMETQGKPGKIQVTAATYAHLQDQFWFEPAQEIEVKGKGRMWTYYLLGRKERV